MKRAIGFIVAMALLCVVGCSDGNGTSLVSGWSWDERVFWPQPPSILFQGA